MPTVSVDGASTVCRTQDYTFSFTLPENCTLINAGYEFKMRGSELDTTLENGIYTASLEASAYAADENSLITQNGGTAFAVPPFYINTLLPQLGYSIAPDFFTASATNRRDQSTAFSAFINHTSRHLNMTVDADNHIIICH